MFGPPLSNEWQIAHFLATSAPFSGLALASKVASCGAAAGLHFAAVRVLFAAGHFEPGLFRLMLFIGDVDERFGAEEQQQCTEHRHGDLIETIMLHGATDPPGGRGYFM